jgi:flagellar basal-body rod protein FlgB
MWDVTTHAVLSAVDGLARRSEVRAHNVANAETPGFRASHVDFESTLAEALRRGTPRGVRPTTVASPTVIDGRGNSVDMETELVGELKDGLHREAMTAAFNFKVGNMRVAMGGRR